MKGKILDFSMENGGIISAEDGKRYTFSAQQWREQKMPVRGMEVDFDIDVNGNAVAVFLIHASVKPVAKFLQSTSMQNGGELSLLDYAIACVKEKYAQFDGRARRKEYWGFYLFSTLASFILYINMLIGAEISETLGGILALVYIFFCLAIFVPNLAVTVRRLHDIDKSGWWLLILLIPIIGWIWMLVLLCQDSTPGENQFGSNPKEV